MTQAELDSGNNIVNTATVTGTGATQDTDDATVPVAQNKVLHIEKDASVPGGTANVVGEMISYTLAVTNTGNAAIANVVVSDPFTTDEAPVSVGGFNSGDTRPGQPARRERDLALHGEPRGDAGRARLRRRHRQHGDGDGYRGHAGLPTTPPSRLRRTRSCISRRTRRFRAARRTCGRDHQLHAGRDQCGQRGDRQRDGQTIRSRPTKRRCWWAASTPATRTRTASSTWARPGSTRQPRGDADRARLRGQHRQHGDGDGRRRYGGYRRRVGASNSEQGSCTWRKTRRFRAARPTWWAS